MDDVVKWFGSQKRKERKEWIKRNNDLADRVNPVLDGLNHKMLTKKTLTDEHVQALKDFQSHHGKHIVAIGDHPEKGYGAYDRRQVPKNFKHDGRFAKRAVEKQMMTVEKRQYQSRLGNGSSIGRRIDVEKAFGNGTQLVHVKGKGGKGMKPTQTGHGRKQMDQSPVHVGRRRNNGRTTATHIVKKNEDVERVEKGLIPTSWMGAARSLGQGVSDGLKGAKASGVSSPLTGASRTAQKVGRSIGSNPGKSAAGIGVAGVATGASLNKRDDRVYNAERNRQRRLDTYAGASGAAGSGLVAGGVASGIKHHKALDKSRGTLKNVSRIEAIHVSPRAASLAAGGAGLIATGVGVRRRSSSRKNGPWT